MNNNAIKFGLLARMIYRLFLRDYLVKAVRNSENEIDDAALEMIDSVAAGR